MITVKFFGPFEGDVGNAVNCATVPEAAEVLREWYDATRPPKGDGGGGWRPTLWVASREAARDVPGAFEDLGSWWIDLPSVTTHCPLELRIEGEVAP